MEAAVTVIMPVYNGEAYLEAAIRSIIDQEYKDWKLLIVNDGSTDGSVEICNRFEKEDERISVIHQENGGLANALNTGLKNSNTDYLTFVDADDEIAPDTLSENLKYLFENPEVELLQYPVYQKFGTERQLITKNEPKLIISDFYINWLDKKKISWRTNDKIFKAQLFNDLKFKEGLIFEDNLLILQLLEKLNNIYLSDRGLYYYYEREGSTTTKPISLKREKDSFYVTYRIFQKLKEKQLDHLAADFLVRLIDTRKSLKVNFDYRVKILKQDDANFLKLSEILNLKFPLKSKIKLILFKISG